MGCDTLSVICGHMVIAQGMSLENAMILIEALAQKWWQEEGLEIMVRKEPPKENCYIVLWKPLEKKYQSRGKLFYEMVWYDEEGVWHVDEDIPQATPLGGCEILFWMPLPDKPEVM